MVEGVGLALAAIILGGALVTRRQGTRRRRDPWSRAASRSGYQPLRSSGFFGSAAGFESPEFHLEIEDLTDRGARGLWTRLEWSVRVPRDLSLRVELPDLELVDPGSVTGAGSPDTGDPSFDRIAIRDGNPDALLAALDQATRGDFETLARAGDVRFRDGRLTLAVHDPGVERSELLEVAARCMRRMAAPLEVVAELARTARGDRVAGVRRKALEALLESHATTPEARETVASALEDVAPEVRVVAARAAEERGRPLLLAIVEDREVDDAVAAEAMRALGTDLPWELAERRLAEGRARGRSLSAEAAIEFLARTGSPAAREPIEVVLREESGALALAAAAALATLALPESMPLLARRLDEASLALARELVTGLDRAGTVAEIPALRSVAERFSEEVAFERQVDRAVRAIQARAPGAGAGQVSLAADGAGRLSLPAAEAGRLALATSTGDSRRSDAASAPGEVRRVPNVGKPDERRDGKSEIERADPALREGNSQSSGTPSTERRPAISSSGVPSLTELLTRRTLR